jgi:hypothetical protein
VKREMMKKREERRVLVFSGRFSSIEDFKQEKRKRRVGEREGGGMETGREGKVDENGRELIKEEAQKNEYRERGKRKRNDKLM